MVASRGCDTGCPDDLEFQVGAVAGWQGLRPAVVRAVFDQILIDKGLIGRKGSIVGARFVEVLRQRKNRKENEQIKEGERQEGIDRTSGFFRAG